MNKDEYIMQHFWRQVEFVVFTVMLNVIFLLLQCPGIPAYLLTFIRGYQQLQEHTLRSSDILSAPRMALSLLAKTFSVSAPSLSNTVQYTY